MRLSGHVENIRLCSCLYLVHKIRNDKNNTYDEVLPRQRRYATAGIPR